MRGCLPGQPVDDHIGPQVFEMIDHKGDVAFPIQQRKPAGGIGFFHRLGRRSSRVAEVTSTVSSQTVPVGTSEPSVQGNPLHFFSKFFLQVTTELAVRERAFGKNGGGRSRAVTGPFGSLLRGHR